MAYQGYTDLELFTLYLFQDGDTRDLDICRVINTAIYCIKDRADTTSLLGQCDVCFLHLLHDGFIEMAHEFKLPYGRSRMDPMSWDDAIAMFPLEKELFFEENGIFYRRNPESRLENVYLVLTEKGHDFLEKYPGGFNPYADRLWKSFEDR